jgi:purine catabolism regulator
VSKLAKSSVFPSVSDVLTMPLIRRGRPRLAAGSAGLDRKVRWVHVAEVADIGPLLRGGELVLTTGIALGDDPAELTTYIDGLADAGASGVVFELVRRWTDALPAALLAAAERRSLPVITLAQETRFVAVTEAVVAMIVDAQLAELRAAEQVHETFTALTVSGAEPSEVLREVARMTGTPVVLETLGHDVLAYDAAGGEVAELLANWAERSRAVNVAERTAYHPGAGWLVTIVGARGNDWGRLVLVSADSPPHRLVVVAERAASALAVNRLVARDRESLERHTHRTLLTELLATGAPPVDLATRAGALGVPLEGRQLVGMAIRPETTPSATQEALRDLAEATASAARRTKIPALVGGVDDVSVRALVSLPPQSNVDASLRRLASQIRSCRQHRARHPRRPAQHDRGRARGQRRPTLPQHPQLPPARRRSPAWPAAPAPRGRAPVRLRRTRTRAAVGPRRRAGQPPRRPAARLLRARRQQVRRGRRRAHVPHRLLPAARPHRGRSRCLP